MQPGLSVVDHLVYAAPDLDEGIDAVEKLTGVRATAGGSHPGMGTRNALLSLGPSSYLEIIGPDPAQEDYRRPRVFRVDAVERPRLVTWAAKTNNISQMAAIRLPGGHRLGSALAGSRRRPGGSTLAWQLTDPYVEIADGVVPFFIDWDDTPHPSADAAGGAKLVRFEIGHPEADFVQQIFDSLGLSIPVVAAPIPTLTATLQTASGAIELR
jgi:hypothetical protein